MDNETIVLLAREFGWTLEEIGKLTLQQVNSLISEIFRQKEMENYLQSYRFGMLASVIVNCLTGKQMSPEEFIGSIPHKDNQSLSREELLNLASQTRKKGKQNDGQCFGTDKE